jgi:hypothetical protein
MAGDSWVQKHRLSLIVALVYFKDEGGREIRRNREAVPRVKERPGFP